jgi:hypothetical protein
VVLYDSAHLSFCGVRAAFERGATNVATARCCVTCTCMFCERHEALPLRAESNPSLCMQVLEWCPKNNPIRFLLGSLKVDPTNP